MATKEIKKRGRRKKETIKEIDKKEVLGASNNIFGVDLSRHNAGINFDVLKNEGVSFAILRAGYTGYGDGVSKAKDDQFENFYNECKNRGIGVGAYWFSIAKTFDEGVAEANYMYENCLKGKQFEYPIYTDVEDDTGGREWLRKAGKEAITDGICGFCSRMEELGFYVGIYANRDWFNNWINQDRVKNYDKWLATWSSAKPDTYLADRMWQFGGETNYIRSAYIDGQVVDQDYCYYDYPNVIKTAGLNGYGSPAPTPEPTPAPQPTVQYVNLSPEADTWRFYNLGVQPIKSNAAGMLKPAKFGGLSYTILGYEDGGATAVISTSQFGIVKIYIWNDLATITNSPQYGLVH